MLGAVEAGDIACVELKFPTLLFGPATLATLLSSFLNVLGGQNLPIKRTNL